MWFEREVVSALPLAVELMHHYVVRHINRDIFPLSPPLSARPILSVACASGSLWARISVRTRAQARQETTLRPSKVPELCYAMPKAKNRD